MLKPRCSHAFPASLRIKGRDYQIAKRVILENVDENHITARVKGAISPFYDVCLSWPEFKGRDILVVSCSCKTFEGGALCKHIWATVLEVDAKDKALVIPGIGPLEIFSQKQLECEDDDDSDSDDDLNDDDSLNNVIFTAKTAAKQSSKRTLEKDPIKKYKAQLKAIEKKGHRNFDPLKIYSEQRKVDVFYCVNIEETLFNGCLVIDFYQRMKKVAGGLGKEKKLRVSEKDVDLLDIDAYDRQSLGLLLGSTKSQISGTVLDDRKVSKSIVNPDIYPLILERLCSRKKLYLGNVQVKGAKCLKLDTKTPYHFVLNISDQSSKGIWHITGVFRRGKEDIHVQDPVIVLPEGIMIFKDRVAFFKITDAFSSWLWTLREDGHINIPKKQKRAIINEVFKIPRMPQVNVPSELGYNVEVVDPKPRMTLSAIKGDHRYYDLHNKLKWEVSFDYSGKIVTPTEDQRFAVDKKNAKLFLRNEEKEQDYWKQLSDVGFKSKQFELEKCHGLPISRGKTTTIVRKLLEHGWYVEAEGKRMRQSMDFNIEVTSGTDWFDLKGKMEFDNMLVELPELIKAAKRGSEYIRLGDGSQGMLPEDWLERIEPLLFLGVINENALRFEKTQAAVLDALLLDKEQVHFDDSFKRLRKKMDDFSGVKSAPQPKEFSGKMRNYQCDGLGWMEFLQEIGFGGCLADDMGLGKTIQVLALIENRRVVLKKNIQPSLVVVPRSLVYNWMEECKKFTPQLQMLDYTGTDRKIAFDHIHDYHLVVTTYGTLRRDITKLKNINFDYVILDEAQAIKNSTSQAAKAVRVVNSNYRLAMTGTPVENNIGELWSLFEFLNPGMLGSANGFKNMLPKSGGGDKSSLEIISNGLKPFILRRTKEEVLKELPKKTEQTIYCELNKDERKMYDDLRNHYLSVLTKRVEEKGINKSKMHVLEALLRLRQIACHPGLVYEDKLDEGSTKIDTLLEQLREILSENHKALIFSQFTSILSIVKNQLNAENINYEYLDGKTRNRKDHIDRFQNDPDCQTFLISLKAGGVGLNLTAADYVFILDPWWNPAVEAQAIDRAHRMGQKRNVFAYRLIARDTVEEKIVGLQSKKRDLAQAIISADNSLIGKLTMDDLTMLLS